MLAAISSDAVQYGFFDVVPSTYIACAARPGTDYVPGPSWQTDPMDPSVMWVLDLARVRVRAIAEIEAAAEEAAARYITAQPSQIARYLIKLEEARAHKAAAYPADLAGYPLIAAELKALQIATPTATAQMASDFILDKANLWTQKAAQIEEARRIGKERVAAAVTDTAIYAARDAAVILLKAL